MASTLNQSSKMELSLNLLNASGVGLLTLALLCVLILRKPKGANGHEPPLAGGGWPIIGHLPLFAGSKIPHLCLGSMADKYGPIFTVRFGSARALVVSNWKLAKECFTTNDMAVSTRPRLVAIQKLTYNQAMFGFSPYGSYWREVRKIATLELLSNRRIELQREIRVSEVETFITELFQAWTNKKDERSQLAMVEMKQWFGEVILNAGLRMIAGKRYSRDSAEARRCLKAMMECLRLLGLSVMGDAIPCLRWMDLGGHEKAMKENAKELDEILEEWLEEHRQKRGLGEGKEDEDFIDVMLSMLDGTELGGFDSDTVIKATILLFIVGAIDTTSVTFVWATSYLLNNPNVLKKAQHELDNQVGRERHVKESDISNLVYIQAIVKETLRLQPPAPLSGPREFTEHCTIAGYNVKKGTRLITNLWKIQTDPSIWVDPLKFMPERFLTTHKDVDVRGHHFEFIPFGSGRRICPGISFALQMIHTTLASFLHCFEISKPFDEPIDMTEIFGLVNTKATPLEVLIKPRLSSMYYQAM